MSLITFKYRLYPNRRQLILLMNSFLSVRFAYNNILRSKILTLNVTNKVTSYISDLRYLNELKSSYPRMGYVDNTAYICAIKNLELSFKSYYNGYNAFPKYKKGNRYSYRIIPSNENIKVLGSYIFLPSIGSVKVRGSRAVNGVIKSVTLILEADKKIFASVLCSGCYTTRESGSQKFVGIDLGVKYFLTTDSGIKVENPLFFENYSKKLSSMQNRLSKMKKGGSNYEKQRIKVAKLQTRIKNKRKDFLDKLSSWIVENYGLICVEDLNVKDLIYRSNSPGKIMDVAWSEFIAMLEYKSKWKNVTLVKVSRWYPSSQICNNCGTKNIGTKNLSVRDWICPSCGAKLDRDINAAKNILNEGIRSYFK